MLQNLYINSKDDYYPEINNVSPEKEGKKSFMYMGHHLYKNLNIFIEYTGKILIGKGFINKYYIHMGYQRAWAYEVLQELVFDNIPVFGDKSFSLEMKNKAWWIE